MNDAEFRTIFKKLTRNAPLSWQERLFRDHFSVKKNIPSVIDLPTGLGKTMVMAIWLIARAANETLPRRLIYVVDRRTVVDQATALATKLQRRVKALHRLARRQPDLEPFCKSFPVPAISTLRGQLADNREWSRNPSRPAIIIGTVDLIGSALLFSGYRSSYKRRPLDAGLLGQDSLLVLDEAHLSRPFERLLGSIGGFNKACANSISTGKPMRVIRMSATSSSSTDSTIDVFRLEGDFDSRTGDFADDTVRNRYKATKHVRITQLDGNEGLTNKLASEAIKLAQDNMLRGKRIVVFVRKPEDAKAVAKAVREHVAESVGELGSKPNKIKNAPYVNSVEVLTGTMRGLERDKLVEKPVLKRFLDGGENPDIVENKTRVFLISTSAGEVGFDLNADHMVCDATTLDSLVQRLGRVNRRGWGDATIVLVREPVKMKDGKPVELKGLDLAIANTLQLIEDVIDVSPNNIIDVSPKNIALLKLGEWKVKYAASCSPDVSTV
ncbi:MAG TPA: type I-U CRISPR-associated helicase/endonuclease Cas3, partial [Pirellulales bacterium]|nr:type I-U CRISPR-associated helicase/endonuclease Cas3 [Pirellulales bacterium]